MNSSLLEIKDLHVVFRSPFRPPLSVIRGVNLTLRREESIALIGESGCGKTTLVKSCMRLLSPFSGAQIVQGRILYQNQELTTLPIRELTKIRGKEMSYLFQDPMSALNPTMKIGKQISESYRVHHPKIKKNQLYDMVVRVLSHLGMTPPDLCYQQYPSQLSGGMRQRVMLAMATISLPTLLIADEPTTALDEIRRKEIVHWLKKIQQERKVTLLLVTHDFQIIQEMCKRIGVMLRGKIIEEGETHALCISPKHPYTRRIIQTIKQWGKFSSFSPEGRIRSLYSLPISSYERGHDQIGCPFCTRCPYLLPICKRKAPPPLTIDQQIVSCWLYADRATRRHGMVC